MTPLDHYAEAERLLEMCRTADQAWVAEYGLQAATEAQAHATLARTASYWGADRDPATPPAPPAPLAVGPWDA